MSVAMVMVLLPVWSVAFAEKEEKMSDALSVIHSRKSVRKFYRTECRVRTHWIKS